MIVMVALVFILIIVLEVPGMIKKRWWKELAAYGFLMLLAMALTFAYLLELPVPNPTPVVEKLIRPFSNLVNSLLS